MGYEIQKSQPGNFKPGDVVLSWNRYSSNRYICDACEQAGGTVVIAENGYIGKGGVSPHHMRDRDPYALALGWHNDASVIPDHSPERWNALCIDLKPFRTTGKHILIAPNRSFGVPGRIMPDNWVDDVTKRLRKLTDREIRVRPHPGNNAPAKPLAEDLKDASEVVIWSSSAGVHALVAGIPVVCEAPYWICKDTDMDGFATNDFFYDDAELFNAMRKRVLNRLAWGQWSVEEIKSGQAFSHLLRKNCALIV